MSKNRNAVQNSPYAQEARQLLEDGLSPERTRAKLVETHGESKDIPSVKSLQRFRRSADIRAAKVLPGRLVDQALEALSEKVDLIGTLDEMISMLRRRALRMWANEEQKGQEQPRLNHTVRTLIMCVRERNATARQLGLQQSPDEDDDPASSWTDEDFNDLMEALRWNREWAEAEQGLNDDEEAPEYEEAEDEEEDPTERSGLGIDPDPRDQPPPPRQTHPRPDRRPLPEDMGPGHDGPPQ